MLTISPTLDEFRRMADDRRVIAVHARLLADDLTPVSAYHTLCGTREYTYLFESVTEGVQSRYSFIGVNSASVLTEADGGARWVGTVPAGVPDTGDPLEVLRAVLDTLHTPRDPELPPFTSGMVGYLGYDVVRRLEKLPDGLVDDLRVPELTMMLASDVVVLDHHTSEAWLVANAINLDGSPERVDAAYDDAVARVFRMAEALQNDRPSVSAPVGPPVEVEVRRQRTPAEFEAMVDAAVEEIRAGEIFQVVPSQRFEMDVVSDPLTIYRQLRVTNPSPYLYLVRLAGFSVVGASPEALVTIRDRTATTHPIAGTRPRGTTEADDLRLERELLADEKERSEHLMLVDLGRNDLGRVCEPGTVTVTEFMHVRRYSHVMHLEAGVTGRLRADRSTLDAVLACFPAGTLSGAPKVRAMEIIDRLELTRRGIYGGVVGYFDFAGDADAAIAIRTALVKDGVAYIQAGAGIVADSVGSLEDAEAHNKAATVISAIRRATSVEGVRGGADA